MNRGVKDFGIKAEGFREETRGRRKYRLKFFFLVHGVIALLLWNEWHCFALLWVAECCFFKIFYSVVHFYFNHSEVQAMASFYTFFFLLLTNRQSYDY